MMGMMHKKGFKFQYFILIACILLIVCSIAVGYTRATENIFRSFAESAMEEVVAQQRFNIEMQLRTDMMQLENIATIASKTGQTDPSAVELLTEFLPNTNFDMLFVVDTKGQGLGSNGKAIDISHREHFKKALTGEVIIGNPVKSLLRDLVVIPAAAPIYDDSRQIVGVLGASYTVEKLENLLLPSFNGNGIAYIIDKNGHLVVTTLPIDRKHTSPEIDATGEFDNATFYEGSKEQLLQDMKENKPGAMFLSVDGNKRFAEYCPIGTDWYLIVSVPYEAVFASMEDIQHLTLIMGMVIILFLLLCCGTPLLMLGRTHLQLEKEHADMHRAIELSERVIMRYYPKTDTAEMFGNFSALCRDAKTAAAITRAIEQKTALSKEGLEIGKALQPTINCGEPHGSCEITLNTSDGDTQWVKIKSTSVFDSNGSISHCLLNLFDVTQERIEKERLTQEAQTDHLTHLLNRSAMEKSIKSLIAAAEENQKMAMLLVDIDNFKFLNDSKGHQFGDRILIEIAKRIKSSFRSQEDIVGRLGGDEFIIFIPQNADRDIVCQRVESFIAELHDFRDECPIAVSVGIAFSTGSSLSFDQLYRHADEAMYQKKINGKDGFSIYSPH